MIKRIAVMLAAVAVGMGVAGAGAPPGWADALNVKIVEKASRSHYPDLSDSEYGSLDPGPVFYTYLPRLWTGPSAPTEASFDAPIPVYAVDDAVRHQEVLLDTFADVNLLGATINDLGRCGSEAAARLLARRLGQVDSRVLRMDILAALLELRTAAPEATATLLDDGGPRVRVGAVRLLLAQEPIPVDLLLRRAEVEQDPAVRRTLWTGLAAVAGRVPRDRWLPLLGDADAVVRAAAVSGLVRRDDADAASLAAIPKDAAPDVRYALAEGLGDPGKRELAAKLLPLLAGDEAALVRAAAARAMGAAGVPALANPLRQLAADPAASVRTASAEQLRHYPDIATYELLVTMTGDRESLLVRRAAADSLEAVAPGAPMTELLDDAIKRQSADIRLWSYRLAARLGKNEHNALIAAQLADERRPENQAAAIRALAVGGARDASAPILAAAEHEAPEVRVAVAEAIGRLDLKDGYDVLRTYATKDRAGEVRQEALQAIGRVDVDVFGPTLLNVLTQVSSLAGIASVSDRVRACWCASRMTKVPDKLAARMADHVRIAVVATEMGRDMDSLPVRASAAFALGVAGRVNGDEKLTELGQNCGGVLTQPIDMMGSAMPPGEADLAYAQQILSFLAGEPVEQRCTGVRAYRFNFSQIDPDARL